MAKVFHLFLFHIFGNTRTKCKKVHEVYRNSYIPKQYMTSHVTADFRVAQKFLYFLRRLRSAHSLWFRFRHILSRLLEECGLLRSHRV